MKCINFGLIKYLVMKRLIFIPLLFLCFTLFGQSLFLSDSIPMITGTDTTIYYLFYAVDNWSIEFDYGDLDDVDGTLDLGSCYVADGTMFDRLDDIRLPFTLADSTVAFEKSNYSMRYLAIKFTKVSNTSGTIFYRLIKR